MKRLLLLPLLILAGCAYIPIDNPSPDFFAEQWRAVLRCHDDSGVYPLPNFLTDVTGGFPRCEASTSGAVGCTTIDYAKRGDVIEINPHYSVTVGKEVKSMVWHGVRIVPIVAFQKGKVTEHLTRHELNHWYFFLKYDDIDSQHKRNYCTK